MKQQANIKPEATDKPTTTLLKAIAQEQAREKTEGLVYIRTEAKMSYQGKVVHVDNSFTVIELQSRHVQEITKHIWIKTDAIIVVECVRELSPLCEDNNETA